MSGTVSPEPQASQRQPCDGHDMVQGRRHVPFTPLLLSNRSDVVMSITWPALRRSSFLGRKSDVVVSMTCPGAGQEPCAIQGQQADADAAGQPGRQLQDRHHLHHLPCSR